jgi:cytochrome c-type biogenesis protein CcmH/NrfG
VTALLTALLAALVVGAALAALVWPLLRPRGAGPRRVSAEGRAAGAGLLAELTRARDAKQAALEDILALEADYRAGVLSEADYLELRRQDEARAIDLIARVDSLAGKYAEMEAAGAPAAMPAPEGPPEEGRRAETEGRSPAPSPAWLRGPALAALGAALLVAGVGAGYLVATHAGPDPLASASAPAGQGGMPGPAMAMVRDYRARLEKDPGDLEALLGMAELNLQRQDLSQAIDFYKRALEVDPGNAEALARFGMVLAGTGHFPEALTALDRALARDPNHVEALWWKGQVQLYGLKDRAGAAATWERVAGLLPPGPEREKAQAALAEARAAASSPR